MVKEVTFKRKVIESLDKTAHFVFGAEISLNTPSWERGKGLFHLTGLIAEVSPYLVPVVAYLANAGLLEGLAATSIPFTLKFILEEVVFSRRVKEMREWDLN